MIHLSYAAETLFLMACLDIHECAVAWMTVFLWGPVTKNRETCQSCARLRRSTKSSCASGLCSTTDCSNPGAVSHAWETAMHRQTTHFHTICLDALEFVSFSLSISTSKVHSEISVTWYALNESKQLLIIICLDVGHMHHIFPLLCVTVFFLKIYFGAKNGFKLREMI